MPRTSDHPRTLFSLVLARIRVTSSACLGRYFYDSKTAELYLYYNGTGTPPPEVVVPTLSDMIVVKGTKEAPAHNITIGPGIQVILPTAPAVSNEGGSSPLLALVLAVSWPWFRRGARWNRLGETVKTRKKREKTGRKWARYSLKGVKEGS